MNKDTVIFLGAGASKAEGAPLQNDLFYEYFDSKSFRDSNDKMDSELADFFQSMFQIDVRSGNLQSIVFPTFEEVLGLSDLAIIRKESFKHFDIESRAPNSGRLRNIAQYLVFLVAKVLNNKLRESKNIHKKLIDNLRPSLGRVSFISTNYDIVIDNVLTELYPETHLDYGIDFENFNRNNDWKRPEANKSVKLLKPHGSLNWLLCPTCNTIEITPKEKGIVTKLISNYEQECCKECNGVFSPLIVPPTFYKEMNNVFLSTIWNKSEYILRKSKHIIFCGYSFPDADIHIKYLLKRAQVNGGSNIEFTVINNHADKNDNIINEEKYRYSRFLGNHVNYTNLSFKDFANEPMSIL